MNETPLTFDGQGLSLFYLNIKRIKQIIHLRHRKSCLFDVTGYNVNLVSCSITEVCFLNITSEKLRIRKVAAVKFALTQVTICKCGVGYIVTLEGELFEVHICKKVVFQIDILPFVKVVSAMFVHVFFAFFTFVLCMCYGYWPDLYVLQVVYYSLCVFVLALGFSYITSAIVVFFKDLTQIIGIVLQVGIWMTPIMWNMETMNLPGWLSTILKFNPMYYIVEGYRDALLMKAWFWEKPWLTLYFWVFSIGFFGLGTMVFRKLKIHFADVL